MENLLFWLSKHPSHYRNTQLIEALKNTMSARLREFFTYPAILCPEFPEAWTCLNIKRREQLTELAHDTQIVPNGVINPPLSS